MSLNCAAIWAFEGTIARFALDSPPSRPH